jgi:hypothetical protein
MRRAAWISLISLAFAMLQAGVTRPTSTRC